MGYFKGRGIGSQSVDVTGLPPDPHRFDWNQEGRVRGVGSGIGWVSLHYPPKALTLEST